MDRDNEVFELLAVQFLSNNYFDEEGKPDFFEISIDLQNALWNYNDIICKDEHHKIKTVGHLAQNILPKVPLLKPYTKQIINFQNQFSNIGHKIAVTGALIFNEDSSKVLLVRGSSKRKLYSFPKGKISSQHFEENACREVLEEIGIDISPYLIPDDYYQNTVDKLYRAYIIKGVPEKTPAQPLLRGEISSIEWVPVNKLGKYNPKCKLLNDLLNKMRQAKRIIF